ncbi:MAG: sulfatase family protein [Promethearchaeota archaeon]
MNVEDSIEAVNPAIKTPNIQRLVRNGVLFERCYAPTPVCLPCRVSVLTGQYPSTHRATHNESFLPGSHPCNLATEFDRIGYYTHIIGKSHFNAMHNPASPEAMPNTFDWERLDKWHGPWMGFKHADIAIGHSTENVACGLHYGKWLVDQGVDLKKYFGNTSYTQYGAWDIPEKFHNSRWVAETTIKAIKSCYENNERFFMWVNFQDPHNPCMVPEPWASMYDPNKIPKYGFKPGEPDSFKDKPPFYSELLKNKNAPVKISDPDLPGFGNVRALDWNTKQVQENAACYYGMISLMDKYIGKILNTLEKTGLLNDTIVIFTSDHGDFLGDHGLFWKSLVSFEEAMHVPLIVSYPKLIPKNKRCNGLHSLVDLGPTLLDLCKINIPYYMEGVNQSATWRNPKINTRNFVVVEERPYNTKFNIRVLINEKYKLCCYADKPYGELYEMINDPHQIHNLWNDPAYNNVKNNLLAQLLSWMMNKATPRPDHMNLLMSPIPKQATRCDEFFTIAGKLIRNPDGQLAIKMPLPVMSENLIEIPLPELLEDLAGKKLIIDICGHVHGGQLHVSNQGEALLINNDQKLDLNEIFEELVGQHVFGSCSKNYKIHESLRSYQADYLVEFRMLFDNERLNR